MALEKRRYKFRRNDNLSLATRENLNEKFEIRFLQIAEAQKSEDKTIKNAFKLADGAVVEGVLIPAKKRMTACISIQVGMQFNLRFLCHRKVKKSKKP